MPKGQVKSIAAAPAPAAVKPEEAKAQRKAALDSALKTFAPTLARDDALRVASGFKPKGKVVATPAEESPKAEPWHIKNAIERGHIKGDVSRLNETLYQFFQDFNEVVDAFGIRPANEESSIDHSVQRDTHGNIIFQDAMTYDRKQRAVPRGDGQAELASENRVRVRTAEGYDKAVRKITSVGAVQNAGYSAARGDLLLAERITVKALRAEEVAAFVGPLLPELLKAVYENYTATQIGESLVFERPR